PEDGSALSTRTSIFVPPPKAESEPFLEEGIARGMPRTARGRFAVDSGALCTVTLTSGVSICPGHASHCRDYVAAVQSDARSSVAAGSADHCEEFRAGARVGAEMSEQLARQHRYALLRDAARRHALVNA